MGRRKETNNWRIMKRGPCVIYIIYTPLEISSWPVKSSSKTFHIINPIYCHIFGVLKTISSIFASSALIYGATLTRCRFILDMHTATTNWFVSFEGGNRRASLTGFKWPRTNIFSKAGNTQTIPQHNRIYTTRNNKTYQQFSLIRLYL